MEYDQKAGRTTFQKMFLAGTAGAFFAGLARNVPVHLPNFFLISGQPVNWTYTFDVGVRYAYVVWFLGYFLISGLRLERYKAEEIPPGADVIFDVVQSIASLGALFCLSFASNGQGYLIDDKGSYRWAVLAADIAVFVICALALALFTKSDGSHKLTVVRVILLLLSALSAIIAAIMPPSFGLLELLAAVAVSMWIPLGIFIQERLKKPLA